MNERIVKAGTTRRAGWAVIGAAMLLGPALALAQTANRPVATVSVTPSTAKPECVYKPVMSDPEIEACTGHKVVYDYTVHESRQPLGRLVQGVPFPPGTLQSAYFYRR